MKKGIIFACIGLVIIICGVPITNKTFFHNYYVVENQKGQEAKITALRFSFYGGEPEKHTAVFYRLGNQEEMQNKINQYVEGLTSCYDDAAFCDTDQDVTIYSYQVSNGFFIHKITLVYDTIDLKDQENATGVDIQILKVAGKKISLQPGDVYTANVWKEQVVSSLNGKSYWEIAVTGRGIATGSTVDKVISAYQIKSNYALWNVTLSGKTNADTTTETRKYVTDQFDDTGVQKATLVIAYYKSEGQWIPLTYKEIEQYQAFLSGKSQTKPYDGIILFQFEFPFSGYSGLVEDKTLAGYSVDYGRDD